MNNNFSDYRFTNNNSYNQSGETVNAGNNRSNEVVVNNVVNNNTFYNINIVQPGLIDSIGGIGVNHLNNVDGRTQIQQPIDKIGFEFTHRIWKFSPKKAIYVNYSREYFEGEAARLNKNRKNQFKPFKNSKGLNKFAAKLPPAQQACFTMFPLSALSNTQTPVINNSSMSPVINNNNPTTWVFVDASQSINNNHQTVEGVVPESISPATANEDAQDETKPNKMSLSYLLNNK